MPRDSTSDRRDALAALVAERGFLRVADASVILGVSDVTVRGDLSALEAALVVIRVHGGAIPYSAFAGNAKDGDARVGDAAGGPAAGSDEPTLEQALAQASETKRAIGEHAASLVESGQSLILDVGSTALAVAEALVRREDLVDVAIITNGLSIALTLEAALPRFTVMVTGGTLRPLQHSLVNPQASTLLESVHADIAFIGCNGIDPVHGVTNLNYPEAEVKRRMLQSSSRHILVADASKLGQAHLGVVGAIEDFHFLVTGGAVPGVIAAELAARGLDVHNVDIRSVDARQHDAR
jgi:DeoR family transcriptional regulator of aga operon